MQFKRWRLVPARPLVNAGFASALFLFAACGQNSGDNIDAPPAGGDVTAPGSGDAITLPAVWSTSRLSGEIRDVALAGGAASMLAVAYEGRGLEFFNLESERIAEPAPLDVRIISNGAYVDFDDAALTLFPGVNAAGELRAYVYADGLISPQEVNLPMQADGNVVGLCSRQRTFANGGALDITFWTAGNSLSVVQGVLDVSGSEFVWEPGEAAQRPSGATNCAFVGDELVFSNGNATSMAALNRPDTELSLTLDDAGALSASGGALNGMHAINIREGLSVRLPQPALAMAALGSPFGGGYPYGLIVVGGDTGSGHQVVFIDAGPLVSPTE